jgi:hypothetical protein
LVALKERPAGTEILAFCNERPLYSSRRGKVWASSGISETQAPGYMSISRGGRRNQARRSTKERGYVGQKASKRVDQRLVLVVAALFAQGAQASVSPSLSLNQSAETQAGAAQNLRMWVGLRSQPHVLGASVRAQFVARMSSGSTTASSQACKNALNWLGERIPHTRSTILATVAEPLGEGQLEEGYDALSRSAELERRAFTGCDCVVAS